MNNNQTIDGVSRELIARAISATMSARGPGSPTERELRALLDAPACSACTACNNSQRYLSIRAEADRDYVEFGDKWYESRCDLDAAVDALAPAAHPQGEPVALFAKGFTTLEAGDGKYRIVTSYQNRDDAWADYTVLCKAEQPAPVAAVPDGYCIMPRQLTAENGAKALLLGEFKLLVTKECPECCELEEPVEGCSICDGEGEYGQKHTIPWDQIKFIYSKAVSGLAMKAESAKT